MKIGVTGHRIKRLESLGIEKLEHQLYTLVHKKVLTLLGGIEEEIELYSGMALGFDTIVSLVAMDLCLPLHAMVPFKGQEDLWSEQQQATYQTLIAYAKSNGTVTYCSEPPFSVWKMHHRNRSIVNAVPQMWALFDGVSRGGTYQCIQYAKRKQIPVANLWNDFIEQVSASGETIEIVFQASLFD